MATDKHTQKDNKSTNSKKPYVLAGMLLLIAIIAGIYLLLPKQSNGAGTVTHSDGTVTYSADIQPVLQQKCISCHSSAGSVPGSPLDSYSNVKNSVVPGDITNSPLIQAVDGGSMSGRLTTDEIDLFKKWVEQGAQE